MGKNHIILMIEENQSEIQLFKECLKLLNSKAELHACKSGADAIDFLYKLRAHKEAPTPDIIISDLNIPGLKASEILMDIKRNNILKHIPFVIFTTSDYAEDIVLCYKYGANAIINKPSDFGSLLKKVKSIIEMLDKKTDQL